METGYKLIVFDKDDTLTLAKQPIDEEMASLLSELLKHYRVAIITWSKFDTIREHILDYLPKDNLHNLIVLPTVGTQWYDFTSEGWKPKYQEFLSPEEVQQIKKAFDKVLKELDLIPSKTWWELVEDRWTQVTYSGLGQKAPLEQKLKFDPDKKIRQKIVQELKKYLPNREIGIAGSTSIDVTRKGLDKAYWIRKLMEHLNLEPDEILFVGDALFAWGNDQPVKKTWIDTIQVASLEDTKKIILKLLKNNLKL